MEVIKIVNLSVRFILELCALAALGYWGLRTANGWILKTILGVGAPLIAAIVWGLFVSPKASYDIGDVGRLGIEIVLFGLAAGALYFLGQVKLCYLFIIVAVISRILIIVFNQ